jgi:NADH:ubiquinone oxidoreductase subunit 6 (subunit J)
MLAFLGTMLTDIGAPLGVQAGPAAMAAQVAESGAVGAIGRPMFLEFGVQLQVTGVLLLVAVVGAVVLAKRRV